MTLVVENGTGLDSAESYISVAELRAYATARGIDLTPKVDLDCEIALRNSTMWIDTWKRYKATRLLASQALEFPRAGLTDWSGFAVDGVPKRVKDACAELAIRSVQGITLAPDQSRDAFVKSESVGPISTTYADNAPQSTVFAIVERLIGQYARDIEPSPPGVFSGSSEDGGQFSVGMHDFTGNW